jgi:hypothetical protein
MSLGGSINHFFSKYKKPLTILVLVFFVYKLFSYYGTVYEGFPGGRQAANLVSSTLSDAQKIAKKAADDAKKKADDAQKKANDEQNIANNAAMEAKRLADLAAKA